MKYYIIIIIFILFLVLYINSNIYHIVKNDIDYFNKFHMTNQNKPILDLLNNNIRKTQLNKKNKILIFTYDNRSDLEYIKMHNINVSKYALKWGYEYKFIDKCSYNNYWCKIYMALDFLKSNKYDYVMWMDSDSVVKNNKISIDEIVNSFDSDIFLSYDNNANTDITNAGIFIIKNTDIGKNYLQDCINNIHEGCHNNDNSLKGAWAASCYEQGIMNFLAVDKYAKYTTLVSNALFFNFYDCRNDVFIMHLYASSPEERKQCFINDI